MEFMEAMAWQAIQSINMLGDGIDPEDGTPVNCCPICCGPCSALNEMISDPIMLNQLSEAIKLTGYGDGWDYWSEIDDALHVGDIKAMWFKPDGSHKAICMSSDGVDQSDEVHRAILADIALRKHASAG